VDCSGIRPIRDHLGGRAACDDRATFCNTIGLLHVYSESKGCHGKQLILVYYIIMGMSIAPAIRSLEPFLNIDSPRNITHVMVWNKCALCLCISAVFTSIECLRVYHYANPQGTPCCLTITCVQIRRRKHWMSVNTTLALCTARLLM
jgi:hypothetical protein